jgi:hypothetical protein
MIVKPESVQNDGENTSEISEELVEEVPVDSIFMTFRNETSETEIIVDEPTIPVLQMESVREELSAPEADVAAENEIITTAVPAESDSVAPATDGNDLRISLNTNEYIDGGRGQNILIGLAGDNAINGGTGHDMLFVVRGDNVINDGDGVDQLVYWGSKRSEFTFTDKGFGITEVRNGDQTDYVTNVELIRFDDGEFKLASLITAAPITTIPDTDVNPPADTETPVDNDDVEPPVVEPPVVEEPVTEESVFSDLTIEELQMLQTPSSGSNEDDDTNGNAPARYNSNEVLIFEIIDDEFVISSDSSITDADMGVVEIPDAPSEMVA